MVNRSYRSLLKKEDGNVMVFGVFGIILLIMFMGVMVDMGLYFVEYKKLGTAAVYADEELQLMLPYYSFADDYREAFDQEFYANLSEAGYSAANVAQSSIKRTYRTNLGNPLITVELNVSLKDTYHCIFLPVIGISEIPVSVSRSLTKNYTVDQFYNPGMPFTEWTGGIELDD